MVKPPFFPVHMADFQGELRCHDLDGTADFAVGSFEVKARPIRHIGHTLGFRIEADGRSVAYISDHQAPLDLTRWTSRSSNCVRTPTWCCTIRSTPKRNSSAMSDWGHSTATYAVRVALEAGAAGCACSTMTRPIRTTRSTGCSTTRGGSPPNTDSTR